MLWTGRLLVGLALVATPTLAQERGLGPTGRRLFASRLEPALGFAGEVGYGNLAFGWRDPLRLELRESGEEVLLERERVEDHPSHRMVTWRGCGLTVEERQFITADDELIDELAIVNGSSSARDLELRLWGEVTPLLERLHSQSVPVRLARSANLPHELDRGLGVLAEGIRTITYDGMSFGVARPEVEEGPRIVAVRGGRSGEALSELPERIAVDLPDVAPAIATLHLLVAAGAPAGRDQLGAPASFLFHFDDGTTEELPWPSIAARVAGTPPGQEHFSPRFDWRFLVLPVTREPALRLAYNPPPGRFLRRLELVKGQGAEVPLLLAATFEIPPTTGRLPALLGERTFAGQALYLTLTGEDFVPGAGPEGQRLLQRSLHLPPGAEERVRVVLCSGARRLMTLLIALDRAGEAEVFSRHLETFEGWFDLHVPELTCSDEGLVRAWHGQWFTTRRSMRRLDLPEFSLPVFYRGLETPGEDRLDLESAPLVLNEVRWLGELSFAQGHLRALLMAKLPGEVLTDLTPGARGAARRHWIAAAALGVHDVWGSRQYLAEVLPSLVDDFEVAWDEESSPGEEDLEALAFRHAAARALARGLRRLGDAAAAERFEVVAARALAAAREKGWGQRGEAGREWLHLGALLPLEPSHLDLLADLESDDLPRDASQATLLIDALGHALRSEHASALDPAHFAELLRAFAERRLGAEGAPPERFDCALADLLIRYVAGVVPSAAEEIELSPLVRDLDHFRFSGIPYHGYRLDITWDRPDGDRIYDARPEGYSLWVDGRPLFHVEKLQRVRGISLVR